jgi:hypothetical protein
LLSSKHSLQLDNLDFVKLLSGPRRHSLYKGRQNGEHKRGQDGYSCEYAKRTNQHASVVSRKQSCRQAGNVTAY